MTTEPSDINSLLVGSGETIRRVPDADFKIRLAKIPELFAARLAFMTPDHHLVRNFAVRNLSYENGMPIRVERIAAALGLPLERVHTIVKELERHLFFLVRHDTGDISWAFPVTSDPTPHRVTLSTGEHVHGACAEDAFIMPFVLGRLRGEELSVAVESECAHCGQALHISIDVELNSRVMERDAEPLLFMPEIDWKTFTGANIIDDY